MKKILLGSGLLLAATAAAAQVAPMQPRDGVQTRAEAVERTRTMFARIDANRDGFITAEELAAARAARQAAMRDAHFKALDTDGDGRVSVAEFEAGHAGPKDGRGRRGRGGPAPGG